jgi:hypothetical protein
MATSFPNDEEVVTQDPSEDVRSSLEEENYTTAEEMKLSDYAASFRNFESTTSGDAGACDESSHGTNSSLNLSSLNLSQEGNLMFEAGDDEEDGSPNFGILQNGHCYWNSELHRKEKEQLPEQLDLAAERRHQSRYSPNSSSIPDTEAHTVSSEHVPPQRCRFRNPFELWPSVTFGNCLPPDHFKNPSKWIPIELLDPDTRRIHCITPLFQSGPVHFNTEPDEDANGTEEMQQKQRFYIRTQRGSKYKSRYRSNAESFNQYGDSSSFYGNKLC